MMRNIIYSIVPLLVLLVTLSLACIVGYFVMQAIGDQFSLSQIITRLTQLFLILSIYPAMVCLKLKKGDLGFSTKAVFLKQVFQGFGLGFVTLIPVFIVLYALGISVIDETQIWTIESVVKKMAILLSLALLISMIEELIFRGILLAGLKKNMSVISAILISSTYFAALHFLSSQTQIPFQEVRILSGFVLLGDAFTHLLNPAILSTFLALLMVGIFLGILRTQVKEGLGLCIGCHTCWVWQIMMNKSLFNTDFSSEYHYLVTSYNGVIGPLVTGWLILAISVYFFIKRFKVAEA